MKKFKRRDKTQSLGEELANAISLGVAALLGIVGLVLLLVKSTNTSEYVGSAIFGASIIILYTMSCLYHSFPPGTTKAVFKRFDHVSIYLLIGGTFAPIFLIALPSPLKWIMLAAQWAIIITGIVLKAVMVYRFQKVHIVLFLLLGWSGVFFMHKLAAFPYSLWYILAGGVAYSIGVIFYALRPFKYAHFIWHLFVIAGTTLQFFAVYLYLLP
ncbi:MAG TPA: hemolysin III family protein [Acholeplasmataceae bacterium]|nr:hemolysin III family protein [Acholeplasmataceae bacterium]HQC30830.1 hemolysin III family protein [Acholeplasmataceae bacterium]